MLHFAEPVQVEVQHTPSMHESELVQSVTVEQGEPAVPAGIQLEPLHLYPGAHSPFDAQAVLHAVPAALHA
jgi:hypothetical protein